MGAGASGAEIASAYARLGVEVLLFEMLDRVLPTEDGDISKVAERGLKRQGIEIHTSTPVQNVQSSDSSVTFGYGEQGGEANWLVIAVEDAAGMNTHPIEHADIPRATFCTPNVASFGLTEEQAREAGHKVVVGKLQYGAVGAGTVYGDRTGMVKIVGEKKYGELLGGHIVGAKATELIQELVNARVLQRGYPEIARIIHSHPTLSEAVMEAARAADGWLIHG